MSVLRRSVLLVLIVVCLHASVSYAGGTIYKYYNKGMKYAENGKFIKAREKFKEALKLDPRHRASMYSLKMLEDALDLKVAKDAVMHIFKGMAALNKHELVKSITEYTKAIEIDPGYAYTYNNMGSTYLRQGNFDRAIIEYTKAIEIDPDDAMFYINRGNAYSHKGQYDRAVAEYTKIIEVGSKLAMVYYRRGAIYQRRGRYDRAIVDYSKVIEIDPKLYDSYYYWR